MNNLGRKYFFLTLLAAALVVTPASAFSSTVDLEAKFEKLIDASERFIEVDRAILETIEPSSELMARYSKEGLIRIIESLKSVIKTNATHIETLTNTIDLMRK